MKLLKVSNKQRLLSSFDSTINIAYPNHINISACKTLVVQKKGMNEEVTIKRRNFLSLPKQVNLWSRLKKTETKMVIDKKTKGRSAVKRWLKRSSHRCQLF
jgi:hypothetical protein